jgi:ABC-type branched-subunit amino acid transport system ATPase component
MLDEPALGLGPKFITVIKKLLREMLNDGGLIVLTEQSLILSPEFANTILVMDAGEIQQSIPKEKASPALLAQTIFSLEKSSVLNNSTESSSSRKE